VENGTVPVLIVSDLTGMGCVTSSPKETTAIIPPQLGRPPRANSVEDLADIGVIEDFYEVDDFVIGEGQFAKVKPCRNRQTGELCAVKQIDKQGTTEDRLVTEIKVLRELKGHPNIVKLQDVFATKSHVLMVMELVNGGELFE